MGLVCAYTTSFATFILKRGRKRQQEGINKFRIGLDQNSVENMHEIATSK